MEKSDAVATLGEQAPALASLLRPAQVRAALKANDRLKLYLSVLQAAHAHAHHPREAALDRSDTGDHHFWSRSEALTGIVDAVEAILTSPAGA